MPDGIRRPGDVWEVTVLPAGTLAEAMAAAERARRLVAEATLREAEPAADAPRRDGEPVTASAGHDAEPTAVAERQSCR